MSNKRNIRKREKYMKKKMDRNYYLLLAGLVTSSLGTQIYDFAVAWYILDITGKASIMSVYL